MEYIKKYRAYCLFLITRSDNDVNTLASLLFNDVTSGNDMAFDIAFHEDWTSTEILDKVLEAAEAIIEHYKEDGQIP